MNTLLLLTLGAPGELADQIRETVEERTGIYHEAEEGYVHELPFGEEYDPYTDLSQEEIFFTIVQTVSSRASGGTEGYWEPPDIPFEFGGLEEEYDVGSAGAYSLEGAIGANWALHNDGDFDPVAYDKNDVAMGSMTLGVSFWPTDNSYIGIKLYYWDFLGAVNYWFAPLFAQAELEYWFTDWLGFSLGRQALTFGEGFIINDLGYGTDGVRLMFETGDFWTTLMYIRTYENYFWRANSSVSPPDDQDYISLYSHYAWYPGSFELETEPYLAQGINRADTTTALGDPDTSVWAGMRVRLRYWLGEQSGLELETEGARITPYYKAFRPDTTPDSRFGDGFYVKLSTWYRFVELGVGQVYFGEYWRTPLGFGFVHDNYYNGWLGFGNAFTWAVMTGPSFIPPTVSSVDTSGQPDPYGVFWNNMQNLRVSTAKMVFYGPRETGVRFDWFNIATIRPFADSTVTDKNATVLGNEFDVNSWITVYEGFYVGAGIGWFFPSASLRERLGPVSPKHANPWALTFWLYHSVEM